MTQPGEELIDSALKTLNQAFALDQEATRELFGNRVPCNKPFADHPTIVCGEISGEFDVGPLGIINGILGKHYATRGERPRLVAGQYDTDSGELVGFVEFQEPAGSIDSTTGEPQVSYGTEGDANEPI